MVAVLGEGGLTTADAAARRAQCGTNEVPRPGEPALAVRFLSHLVEPLAAVLLAAAGLSWLALDRRAEAAALEELVPATAKVWRDGQLVTAGRGAGAG